MTAVTCIDCGGTRSSQSKTGRCKRCSTVHLNTCPDFQKRRVAAIRKRYHEPVFRAKQAAELHRRHMTARADPEKRKRIDGNIWIARARLDDPDVRAAFLASRKLSGEKRTETVMAWCPPAWRDEYYRLTRSKRILAADARRIIEAEMARDMTPHERAMEKVRNGAGIHTEPPMPRRVEGRTLGGVSEALY